MQSVTRAAAAALRRSSSASTAAVQRRSMSSGVSLEEEKKQMDLWRVITYAAIPAVFGFTFYTLANEEHHAGEKPEREYLRTRAKPFPWRNGDEPLFTKKGGHH